MCLAAVGWTCPGWFLMLCHFNQRIVLDNRHSKQIHIDANIAYRLEYQNQFEKIMSIGPLMIDLSGYEISAEESEWLEHPSIGGVILFARNYADRDQLTGLVKELHAIKKPKLLVAVDQEGGRVQRLRDGFIIYPPARSLGEIYDSDPKRALHLSETVAWCLASELREVGIDFTFAPVLDLDVGVSEVIGDRAFHSNIDAVSALASKFIIGLRKGGMEAVGKHFPGHGSVCEDSHVDCPVDHRYENDLWLTDIVPFQRLVDHGIAGMMSAHVIFDHVDKQPASFSSYWLTRVLREQLGFQGAVFSDDLTMQGAKTLGDIKYRVQTALAAGSDMVLICNSPQDIPDAIELIDNYNSPSSQLRLARFHGKKPQALSTVDKKIIETFVIDYEKNKSLSLNLD